MMLADLPLGRGHLLSNSRRVPRKSTVEPRDSFDPVLHICFVRIIVGVSYRLPRIGFGEESARPNSVTPRRGDRAKSVDDHSTCAARRINRPTEMGDFMNENKFPSIERIKNSSGEESWAEIYRRASTSINECAGPKQCAFSRP